MMNKIFLGTVLAVSLSAAMPLTAGDMEAGKAKSASCAGCHGTDGNSATTFMWEYTTEGHAIPYTEVYIPFEGGVTTLANLPPSNWPNIFI